MPKRRYEHREPTHDWQQIRPLLKDSAQITYEILRPVLLWGQTPKEQGAETGMSPRTIYYRTNLFDQAGMASLLPPVPPPPVPKQDKRELPPPIRQEIVNLYTEYPAQKTTLKAVQEVKKLAENPELVAYWVSTALEQPGIKLSRTTCCRLLALNRDVYHLQLRSPGGRPKAVPPFKASHRHEIWSVDIRYLDMHRLENKESGFKTERVKNYD